MKNKTLTKILSAILSVVILLSSTMLTSAFYGYVDHVCSAETLTFIEGVEAWCKEDGNIPYYECECGLKYYYSDATLVLDDYMVIIPATGHTWGEGVYENVVDATCTEGGSGDAVIYCTVCDEELSRESTTVEALGHTWGEGVVENETDDSYDKVVYCDVCGQELSRETLSADMVGGDVKKTTVKFVQGSGDKKVTGKVDVSFKQSWFKGDSKTYNHNLARLCSQYVMLGYDNSTSYIDKPNLRKALETIGMENIEIIGQAGKNHVNYFIASRKILVDSKVYDLIFVGLIGSYHEQWYSNFDPGLGKTHKGFLSAKEFVYTALDQYIKEIGFAKDRTKILITGHSRGAAASNLLAADLIKSEAFAKKENIYTYAFATPNSTTLQERTDAKFDRIYNIVNPEDFVTKCMPVSWGYGRYGKTYVLPSKSNEKNSDYKVYKSNMQKYFSYFTNGGTYKPYLLAEADTRAAVMALTSAVRNVNQFYNKPLLAGVVPMSAHKFFQNSLCHFVSGVASTGDKAAAVSIILGVLGYGTSSVAYREIVDYFLLNGTALNPRFEHAHMAETYCAYMMSMTESQIKEERKGCLNTVNCPVDVTIIDKDTNEIVGRIINNSVDEKIAAKENAIVMDVEGDSKSFWLPSNGDYEVILTGNDNGTMDYTVSEIDSDLGETERINFYDVEITKGDSYIGEFNSDNFDISKYKIVTEDGEVILPDEKLDDNDLGTIEIDTSIEGDGYVTESMTVTKGDYVVLEAVAIEKGEFLGWYENGELICEEETYSFVAKGNREITAKFTEVEKEPEEFYESISLNYNDIYGVGLKNYINIPDGMTYTFETETTDKGVAQIIQNGNGFQIFTLGTGTATVKATVTLENGEVYIFEYDVEVTYTWWQWLIVIFLFGWIWY